MHSQAPTAAQVKLGKGKNKFPAPLNQFMIQVLINDGIKVDPH